MLLSFDKRFLFVANTKTASTSIEAVLRPHAQIVRQESAVRKHVTLAAALRAHAADFAAHGTTPDRILTFGVMRDPIEWIGSWYRYRSGNTTDSPLPSGMTFAEFWERADWSIRRRNGDKQLQRRMFTDKGRPIADIIIPFPKIAEVFGRIRAGLDLPPGALPRQNASVRRDMPGLTPALEALMRDYYARDYDLLRRLDAHNAPALADLDVGRYRA